MKIYQLFHKLVELFVPLNETEKLELQTGAIKWYDEQTSTKAIREAKNAEIIAENEAFANEPDYMPKPTLKPTIKEKAFELFEIWWFRYIIAIAFIFLVPYLKRIINDEGATVQDDDDISDEEAFEQYLAFKRFKHRNDK